MTQPEDATRGAGPREPGIELDGDGPVHEQIRRAIAARIVSGAWRPGARVPTEHALMQMFGSSRMTVHRALSALAGDGLIVRRRRAGTVVAPRRAQHTVLAIPSIPDEIAAEGQIHRFELLRRSVVTASEGLAMSFSIEVATRALALEGVHYASGVPHVLEHRIILLDAVPEAEAVDFAAVPPGTWLLENVVWTAARHSIAAVAATAVQAGRLALRIGDPCLLVERQTWRNQQHLTSVRLLYPGGRHRLVGTFGPYDRVGRP